MPFEQQFLVAALAVVATIIVIWLSLRPKQSGGTRETLGDIADLDPNYQQNLVMHLGGDDLDEPWRRAERNVCDHPPRETRHIHPNPRKLDPPHVPLASRIPYHTPPIMLTPRHLEHVNILRRCDGKLPLNTAGFRNAIARQPVPLRSISDWTGYLIAYAALSSEHEQSRVACEHPITIQPDAPFNGQGGEFAGAGATSSFDAPADADLGKAATQGQSYGSAGGFAAVLAAGAALAGADPGPLHDGSLPPPGGASYPGNDLQWSKQGDPPAVAPEPQSAPEPAPAAQSEQQPDPPSYSAPEPSYSAPDTSASGGND